MTKLPLDQPLGVLNKLNFEQKFRDHIPLSLSTYFLTEVQDYLDVLDDWTLKKVNSLKESIKKIRSSHV